MLNSFGFGIGKETGADREGILNAALEVFSEKGYSGTSLETIAKKSNTTEKNIINLFHDKEDLFENVLSEQIHFDKITDFCSSVLEMFAAVVDAIKRDAMYNPTKTAFIDMIIHSSDIPEEAEQHFCMKLAGSKFYRAVDNARLQGIIDGSDAMSIIRNFIKSTFSIIEGYNLAGIKIPDAEWFIGTLLFKKASGSDSLEEIIKKQTSIIDTFVADYQSILFVDLDTKEVNVYKTNGDDDSIIKAAARKGYGELRRKFAEDYLFPEDIDWFMQETDPQNIIDKLMDDPVLYIEHRILCNSKPYFYQTIIALDPAYQYGNKVIMGGHRIRKTQRPGMKKETDNGSNDSADSEAVARI